MNSTYADGLHVLYIYVRINRDLLKISAPVHVRNCVHWLMESGKNMQKCTQVRIYVKIDVFTDVCTQA